MKNNDDNSETGIIRIPFLDQMMDTAEAAEWLKINSHNLLRVSKGLNAKIPGFWITDRIVRFHPRTIIVKVAFDAGVPPEVIMSQFTDQ